MHFSLVVQTVIERFCRFLSCVLLSSVAWIFGLVIYIFLVNEKDSFFLCLFILGVLLTAAFNKWDFDGDD